MLVIFRILFRFVKKYDLDILRQKIFNIMFNITYNIV